MAKILVTGGAGFIGSHTCVELLEAGYEVVIVDNFSNSKPEALNRIKKITGKDFAFYEADLLDLAALEKIFEENKIDAVIHFAGLKAVGESVQKPVEYYHNNITGTLMLIKAMRKYGCKKIVFSSSATVYGPVNKAPYTEDMPTSATNPYGYTKVMIEQILRDVYVSDNDWSVSLLRYFNPIGAHKSGLIGEDPNGIPNNLLPYICQVAVGKLEKLGVFGDDYDLHSFEKACGKKLPYVVKPRRAGDLATCYADTAKAKKVFGWEAQYGLDEMTADSWNFIKNNPNGL